MSLAAIIIVILVFFVIDYVQDSSADATRGPILSLDDIEDKIDDLNDSDDEYNMSSHYSEEGDYNNN